MRIDVNSTTQQRLWKWTYVAICRLPIQESCIIFCMKASYRICHYHQKFPSLCLDRRPSLFLHDEKSHVMFLPIGFWVFVEQYPQSNWGTRDGYLSTKILIFARKQVFFTLKVIWIPAFFKKLVYHHHNQPRWTPVKTFSWFVNSHPTYHLPSLYPERTLPYFIFTKRINPAEIIPISPELSIDKCQLKILHRLISQPAHHLPSLYSTHTLHIASIYLAITKR